MPYLHGLLFRSVVVTDFCFYFGYDFDLNLNILTSFVHVKENGIKNVSDHVAGNDERNQGVLNGMEL
jgi:hypothetical protein